MMIKQIYLFFCSLIWVHVTSFPLEKKLGLKLTSLSAVPKILVLGGSGFVGSTFIKRARSKGYSIVSVSRRGTSSADNGHASEIKIVQADATDKSRISQIIEEYGPFDSCVHAIGLLLDVDSGLGQLNKFASGSGSEPGSDSTYDRITRLTALNAIEAFSASVVDRLASEGAPPFIFISAAEAGWTYPCPIPWLEKYLVAKRAVEKALLSNRGIRGVIMRPSLIWTWERPQALLSVLPFYIGSKLGLPFVDEPVLVETLVDAALFSIKNKDISGVQRYNDMQRLANSDRR